MNIVIFIDMNLIHLIHEKHEKLGSSNRNKEFSKQKCGVLTEKFGADREVGMEAIKLGLKMADSHSPLSRTREFLNFFVGPCIAFCFGQATYLWLEMILHG